jgi:hypothetical protein
MHDIDSKKVKLIYRQLQGYLSQIPLPKDTNEIFHEKDQWEYINNAIDNLNSATRNNYDDYKTFQRSDTDGWSIPVKVTVVRSKLGALINVLHEEYFSTETSPFSGNPNATTMVIHNQNSQQQNQNQQQEQKIELEQLLQNAQETIRAEYGEDKANEAIDLIKKIALNPKNWAIVASAIIALTHIGHVAFVAALPILGKILLNNAPTERA